MIRRLMLIMTTKGLYCPAGDFYIDPRSSVNHAVITHAHSDHAKKGSQHYYCTHSGASLLKARLGKTISLQTYPYSKQFYLGKVALSFHPAGHILGSAQIRLEYENEIWVVSGDYKRNPDPTCEPFEIVPCDVFITEATFGTPAYLWDKNADLGSEIFAWWSENQNQGKNSIIYAYSLGKAQRVLALLESFTEKPIYCDLSMREINNCYRAQGIKLANTLYLHQSIDFKSLQGELFILPPAFKIRENNSILNFKTAFTSGWMRYKTNRFDRGFLLSDHADWNDLINTIQETRAQRVYVQHRGYGVLIKKLKSMGIKAFPDSALIQENPAQLSFLKI